MPNIVQTGVSPWKDESWCIFNDSFCKKKKKLNTVDTSYKIFFWHERKQESWRRDSSLDHHWREKKNLLRCDSCTFEVLPNTSWAYHPPPRPHPPIPPPLFFNLVKHLNLPPKQKKRRKITKHPRFHPGGWLDRDDTTRVVYQISLWQIRPAREGAACWWERLWLKIGRGGFYGMCVPEGTMTARTGMLVVVTAVTGGCLCGTTRR